jgi:hypothetical protein
MLCVPVVYGERRRWPTSARETATIKADVAEEIAVAVGDGTGGVRTAVALLRSAAAPPGHLARGAQRAVIGATQAEHAATQFGHGLSSVGPTCTREVRLIVFAVVPASMSTVPVIGPVT